MPGQSLVELTARLNKEGYTDICRTEEDGVHFSRAGQVYAPEELKVDQVHRIEGTSAPDEEVVLFAITSPDGRTKGTFSSPHGIESDPLDADTMQRLRVPAGVVGGGRKSQPQQVTRP